jgi:hypothetical protein
MSIKTHNNTLQGTCGQRGFPRFSLAAKDSGESKLVAVNPAGPCHKKVKSSKMFFSQAVRAHRFSVFKNNKFIC